MGLGVAAAFSIGLGVARAAVPADVDALVYAGVFEEDGVLVEGARALRVEVYGVEIGGSPLCFAEDQAADVRSGRFRIAMPDCAADLRSNAEAFVEVKLDGTTLGRSRVGAVPYALEAGAAGLATGPLRGELDATAGELSQTQADVASIATLLRTLGFAMKNANNGTSTCEVFCQQSTLFGQPLGGCIGGVVTGGVDLGLQVGCAATPPSAGAGTSVACACSSPIGDSLPALP